MVGRRGVAGHCRDMLTCCRLAPRTAVVVRRVHRRRGKPLAFAGNIHETMAPQVTGRDPVTPNAWHAAPFVLLVGRPMLHGVGRSRTAASMLTPADTTACVCAGWARVQAPVDHRRPQLRTDRGGRHCGALRRSARDFGRASGRLHPLLILGAGPRLFGS